MHKLTILILLLFSLTVSFNVWAKQRTHVVKSGDSVAKIADYYGVSQRDLRAENNISKDQSLKLSQKLLIPSQLRGGASQKHIVKKGDTLASIAKKYKIKKKKLAVANKMPVKGRLQIGRTLVIPRPGDKPSKRSPSKKTNKLVKTGKKVPGGVRHEVQRGQSLWIIARAYNVKGEKIAKANKISIKTSLKAGQNIFIPGAKSVVPVRTKGFRHQKVTFKRSHNTEKISIRLLNKKGGVNQKSRKALSRLCRSRKIKNKRRATRMLHPRLLNMLQRVAERFPDHAFVVISGYRPARRGHSSQHTKARALDFRLEGVSNKELYTFIKQLPNVGVGYYPNSTFVHLDVRDRGTQWTDLSGPGQEANYVKKGESGHFDSVEGDENIQEEPHDDQGTD